ncbi:hypothetical protein FG379_001395 [Cryptosporidium bovis]|uniref:uncharacterized protein n=1 Tax=Cryptosporidium bovis TaxID=310047 RepID=UPI00351A0CC9|nr:hypothetical protein FG379_001395 [Cryptosporidium bovis]
MGLEMDLGNYNNVNFQRVSNWVVKHISDRDKNTIVGLQFNEYDVEYGPKIQFLIEKSVSNKLKVLDGERFRKFEIRFVIISDNLNPLCCIDTLNIKKSHSDLLLRFGECCYTNIAEFDIPLLFIRPDPYYNFLSKNNSDFRSFAESVTKFLRVEISKMTDERASFEYNLNKNGSEIEHIFDVSVIFSFQNMLINSKIKAELLNLVAELNNSKGVLLKSINGYLVSDIESNEDIIKDNTKLMCNRIVDKLSRDTPELDLIQIEAQGKKQNNKIIFVHIIPKEMIKSNDKNVNRSTYFNCFLKRVYLRYNQVFKILITELNYDCNWSLSLNSTYYDDLDKYIAKRFIYIERALSIQKVNRVAFMIFPRTTSDEWKLIDFYSTFTSRKDINNHSRVRIETHIILFTSISEVKLRNFTNIDIYCYFGCPEYFIYHIVYFLNIKSPVILTPYEYEVYLGIREWTPTFLDSFDLFNKLHDSINAKKFFSDESEAEYSNSESDYTKLMITNNQSGNIQIENNSEMTTTKYDDGHIRHYDSQTKKLILRLKAIKTNLSSSFYGLDPFENTNSIPKVTQGRYGVASIYLNETQK